MTQNAAAPKRKLQRTRRSGGPLTEVMIVFIFLSRRVHPEKGRLVLVVSKFLRGCLYLIYSHSISEFQTLCSIVMICRMQAKSTSTGSAKGVIAAGFADRRMCVAYRATCKKGRRRLYSSFFF